MVVSLAYTFWRALRVTLVIATLSCLALAVWWLSGLFLQPIAATYVLLACVPLLCLLTIVFTGSSAQASAAWQTTQTLATHSLYASLYDLSPIPYLTLDARGQIVTCNLAAARLLDLPLAEMKGKDIISRLYSDDETKLSLVLGKIRAGTSIFDSEVQIESFKGDKKWVSLSLFVNQTYDQQLVALVDISHQKLVDKAKSEFVSLATHQLRTPVAALRWNVELLERTLRSTVSDKQQIYLIKINRNVTRMLALINDFLSVSKLETGTFATTPETLVLDDYLATIVDEYQQDIIEKQIALTTSFKPAGLALTTDHRLFHIITSNLLSNAVKYVRPSDTITFSYALVGREVEIIVADTGIGIPALQQAQLFTKFFRASNATIHRAEGTGLGLYIVKESVAKLGGTIAVVSEENKGTAFTVRLPLQT